MDIKNAWEILKEKVHGTTTTTELLNILNSAHKSDAYLLLRDEVTPLKRKQLLADEKTREGFKKLEKEANDSWTHDHTSATMLDVDKACTQVYTICLRMIRSINDDQTKMKDVINSLEKHLELPETKWVDEPEDADVPIIETAQEVVVGEGNVNS